MVSRPCGSVILLTRVRGGWCCRSPLLACQATAGFLLAVVLAAPPKMPNTLPNTSPENGLREYQEIIPHQEQLILSYLGSPSSHKCMCSCCSCCSPYHTPHSFPPLCFSSAPYGIGTIMATLPRIAEHECQKNTH